MEVPKPGIVERVASLMKRSPYKDVPSTDVMKRSHYKDVPWPSMNSAVWMKRSPYKDVPWTDLIKRNPYKDTPWPSIDGLFRKTLTRAPAAETVGREAVSLGGGGGGGGGGGPERSTYVPCRSPKRSRRGSRENGPVVRQAQWRNADDTIRVGLGCGGREVEIFENINLTPPPSPKQTQISMCTCGLNLCTRAELAEAAIWN